MQLTKYVDKRGWIYFVRSGIGRNNFKTFYKKPDRMGEHGCSSVEWRNTEQQAQEDLDALAKKKGWKGVKNI